jgi:hypothetical protein
MFTKREAIWIFIASLVMGFMIAFPNNFSLILLPIAFIIILTNVIAKKLVAKHFGIDIQHQNWEFQRYGWYERSKFKKPFPIGLVFPFLLTIFSLGIIKPLTLLQFKSKPSKTRVARKRARLRYSEQNEEDMAFTAAFGFWALIILSLIGTLINQPELTKYSIYYGIWNLLPLSSLDGNKLFFGSLFNWIILTIVYIIALVAIII